MATGDPPAPAGAYRARAALTSLGVWNQVKDRLIPADNVRTAPNFVALGEALLGIVYATDARGNDRARVVDTFDASHERITYPCRGHRQVRCADAPLRQYPRSEPARASLDRAGAGRP